MDRVWRELPSEILEEVVAFLPLATLCRFRAVSKKWNKFISHPDFASRHAQASSPEEYVLISEREVDHQWPIKAWEVLDVASKRSFILSADFLAEFVKQEGVVDDYPQARVRSSERWTILAADGGLLFLEYCVTHLSSSDRDLGTDEVLLVCNPVLKTVKQLPHFQSERPDWVVMSTDRDSMEYEICFITLAEDVLQPNPAYITYESKTASWWASAAVPGQLNSFSGRKMKWLDSVGLQDEFYALFLDHDGFSAELVSYNKVTGAVSCLGIDVPCVYSGDSEDYWVTLQLVVSDGRLFCVIMHVGCRAPIIQHSSIEIVEFILTRGEYIHLSTLGGEILDWFLGNSNLSQVISDSKYDTPIVATGLANSILLHSFAGRSMAYDLLVTEWHKYPDCYSLRGGRRFLDFFARNLCLSLCPP